MALPAVLPSSNWAGLQKGLLVPSTPVLGDRYAEDEARRIVWCNCAACALVAKPAIDCHGLRDGRFFSSMAATVEHSSPYCMALLTRTGNNWDCVAITSGTACHLLQRKLAVPKGKGHSLCELCLDECIESQSWVFDNEEAEAASME